METGVIGGTTSTTTTIVSPVEVAEPVVPVPQVVVVVSAAEEQLQNVEPAAALATADTDSRKEEEKLSFGEEEDIIPKVEDNETDDLNAMDVCEGEEDTDVVQAEEKVMIGEEVMAASVIVTDGETDLDDTYVSDQEGSAYTDPSECSDVVECSFIDLSPWDNEENSVKYHLWKTDQTFWNNAVAYVNSAITYGNGCIETCIRAHGRRPTVNEFWNYYMSKRVPRQSWYAIWRTVNHERRGWPLQYSNKAKVLVKSIFFSSALSDPKSEVQIVESLDSKFDVGQNLDICLWQLEPVEAANDFYHDGITVEEGKVALNTVRKFYEEYYFSCDTNDFIAFYENFLYDRLEQVYYLANLAPTIGVLSHKDRGKIIAGIKHYHYLQNGIQDLMNQMNDLTDGLQDASNRQEKDSCYLTLKMQLDRHKVELRFLLDKTLRALMGAIDDKTSDEDSSISNFDCVVVMKQFRIEDLQTIHAALDAYSSQHNISNIRVITDLETALRNCKSNSTIFVLSGDYAISGLGRLGSGGSLIGINISNQDVTITHTDDIGDIWLIVSNENGSSNSPLTLKNLDMVIEEENGRKIEPVFVGSGALVWDCCTLRNHKSTYETTECLASYVIRCAEGAEVQYCMDEAHDQ